MTSQFARHENELSESVGALKVWKELIDKYLNDNEKAAETAELEELVKDFCLLEYSSSRSFEACQEVSRYFESSNAEEDVDEVYKEKLSAKEGFSGDVKNSRIWKEVFLGEREVEEVRQAQSQEEAEEEEYEELQDSIYCSNVFTPPVDPISKFVVKEPFKNRVCGHVYDYKYITQHIKSMKNKARCPYVGCVNAQLTMNQLVKDDETQRKITEFQAKQASQQEDSD